MNPNLEQSWNGAASALRGYVRSRVRDHFAAEDILQDVYLKAHARLAQVQQPARLQSWLFQIAKHAIIDYYRKLKPTEEVSEFLAADPTEPSSAEAEKLKESFREMLLRLPEPYREAVILADLEGVAQKDLAQRLGISLSGAKSRVQRGRAMLKKDLLDCCQFEFDRRGKIIDYTPKADCCTPAADRGGGQVVNR